MTSNTRRHLHHDHQSHHYTSREAVKMHVTLRVENLSVKLTEPPRQILSSICAHVKPGQILAVMGPSGSGKTTLLSALSGRTKYTGRVLLNGSQLNKTLRRQICYVLQNDVFFSNLTLRQTLVYSAMLRLPDSMPHEAKMRQVDQVIDALDLKSCQDTIIGDYMRRGLSGGEKKRCSIACELLSNPSVMMLDEPTSSLDSCSALNLVKLLKEYAIREQKTIILSIHQPSSQIFYLFDKLLLLSQGRMIYFGGIQPVLPYFQHFNYHMRHLSYNPADFVMEILKSVDDPERDRLAREAYECFFSMDKRVSIETGMSLLGSSGASSPNSTAKTIDGNQLQHQFVAPQDHVSSGKSSQQDGHGHDDLGPSLHSSWSKIYIYDDHDDAYSCDSEFMDQCCQENKWPSGFFTQLYALTSRNFIDGKARMLSKLNWVQTIGLALISGLIWFQVKRSEETLTDIKGWMYFSTMYWMMFAQFNAITSFPGESQVINKERSAGSYRLSSYYLAKMIGELPLVIALPSAFHLISYPLLGFHSFYTFFGLWGFAILNALAAQSVGMFIGFTFNSLELCITLAALYSSATMLFGGFYTNTMPLWLDWLRYGSIVYYGYLNMQMVEFGTGLPVSCAIKSSRYPTCQAAEAARANRSLALTDQASQQDYRPPITFIPNDELQVGLDPMRAHDMPNPIWFNTLCLIGFFLFFRLLGYIVLRIYHKPS